jgi:uncharacterized membrane protein
LGGDQLDRSQRILLIALSGTLLAAFALRLENLGVQSLWYDETVSAYLATQSLGSLIAHTARDIHPPLYYIWLHFWQGLVGSNEFSLAFLSLFWGLVLIASTATFARWLGGNHIGLVTAALVALSPFNVWYSQEVRMYTLGTTFGVWSLMALWRMLTGQRMKKRWMGLWLFSAVMGLYTLYYFAFLLLWEAIFVAWSLWRHKATIERWRRWLILALMSLLFWAPWIPIAFRQATNPPVPPWRDGTPISTILQESLSALVLGQSVDYRQMWLLIVPLMVVMGLGLRLRWQQEEALGQDQAFRKQLLLLSGALLLPLLILILSSYTSSPLYHVRYLFTYSPVFYILLAMAFVSWARQANKWAGLPGAIVAGVILITPLLILSAESLQRFWYDTAYAADDLRGGVKQIEALWRSEDVVLMNAGYTYTALNYYFDDPIAWQGRLPTWAMTDQDQIEYSAGLVALQTGSIGGEPSLGWGLAESDFYAISEQESVTALNKLTSRRNGLRLWHYRLYDTVTDPDGFIRDWLSEHGLLFHDQLMTGESNARLQGWYFPQRAGPGNQPDRQLEVYFAEPESSESPSLLLHGVDESRGPHVGGAWVDINIWLEALPAFDPATRLSLGLFDTTPARRQWVIADEQPLGPLLSLKYTTGMQPWPVRLRLPQGIPPGKYDALLKFYHPASSATLKPSGERVEPGSEQVQVAVVEVGPTPPQEKAPQVGTPLEARFGSLQLLGHAIPAGPWLPGSSISVELVWEVLDETTELRAFVTSDALISDDGGVTQYYPLDEWGAGEVVRDVHYVSVAPDVAPGEYPLYLQVSRGANMVSWSKGLFRNGDLLQLGSLTIQDRPRTFEPPAIETPLDIAFGESMQLIGATLPAAAYVPGEEVPLTLNWYANVRPPARYKIFTHLIDANGNFCGQRDLEPGDGSLPTNGWARGEYVTTNYTIPLSPELPPGTCELRIGLYDPTTNERVLPIGVGANGLGRHVVLGRIEVR